MRRSIAISLSFAACLATFFSPDARSQDPTAPSDESITTFDGVKLDVKFYKAGAQKNGSVVILLHAFGKDPNKGDWDGLAKTLTKEGFNVVRFDFRGHGKSTDVVPEMFWKNDALSVLNKAHMKGATKNPPAKEIFVKDFEKKNAYFPMLVNDIAAIRSLVDVKNDLGEVNSSSVYFVGAGDAATLGMMFMTSEWHRDAKLPNVAVPALLPRFVSATGRNCGTDPAGRDYGGGVWLSPTRHPSVSTSAVENWVAKYGRDTNGDMRKETPMLFVHGDKDKEGDLSCKYFTNQVMVAGGKTSPKLDKLDFTFLRTVKGTDLKGVDLLGKDATLGTEKMIIEFLNKMEVERKKKNRYAREYKNPLPIVINSFLAN